MKRVLRIKQMNQQTSARHLEDLDYYTSSGLIKAYEPHDCPIAGYKIFVMEPIEVGIIGSKSITELVEYASKYALAQVELNVWKSFHIHLIHDGDSVGVHVMPGGQ